MKKLLAVVLGGLIAFVWSAIIHMNPATGGLGLSRMNEKTEDTVMAALKANVQADGLYFYPGIDMSKKMSDQEEAAWTAKYKAGPAGLLLYHPTGGEPMQAKLLVVEFVADVVCALIAVIIIAGTGGGVLYRATIVAMLGLFAWFTLSVSQWNWYGFPFKWIMLDVIDQVAGWFLAGMVMAKLVKAAPCDVPAATRKDVDAVKA
jgi:hypothetical protein